MRAAIEAQLDAPAGARWLVDKVLHGRLSIVPRILARNDVRAIVLLRRPAASIASIVRMAREHLPGDLSKDPASTADHYVRRLGTIASCVPALAPRLAYVAAERLVDAPDEVLGGLSRWLGLARPLASTYRTFASTGRATRSGFPMPRCALRRPRTTTPSRGSTAGPCSAGPSQGSTA